MSKSDEFSRKLGQACAQGIKERKRIGGKPPRWLGTILERVLFSKLHVNKRKRGQSWAIARIPRRIRHLITSRTQA